MTQDFDIHHGGSHNHRFGDRMADDFFHNGFEVGNRALGDFLDGWIALFSYCGGECRLYLEAEIGLYRRVVSKYFQGPGNSSGSCIMRRDDETKDLYTSVSCEHIGKGAAKYLVVHGPRMEHGCSILFLGREHFSA